MNTKIRVVMGTALALPLLAPPIAESAIDNEVNASSPSPLTEKQLDEVTAGKFGDIYRPILPDRPSRPAKPWEPIEPCCTVTTMALGEEGGGLDPIYHYEIF